MDVSGDEDNWNVILGRSYNDKILILSSAMFFFSLTLMVAWRIAFSDTPLSGLQDLLAIAGYIVAAVSFRELLGANMTASVSVFEILAFIIPLMMLFGGYYSPTLAALEPLLQSRRKAITKKDLLYGTIRRVSQIRSVIRHSMTSWQ